VIIGAILTQNTAWPNVEKAIKNLKKAKLLDVKMILKKRKEIARLIRPAGYYNVKARRLLNCMSYLDENYQGEIKRMERLPTGRLRRELLAINGIGPETADSILLYALNRPVFVVDAYTRRFLLRHNIIKEDASYDEIQDFFIKSLKSEVKVFNEFHALIVRLGKTYCLKNEPLCSDCPLNFLGR
ncbi:MAG: endonuclease III domain-containing protein, partial [candidate division WOR-3 bacterium]